MLCAVAGLCLLQQDAGRELVSDVLKFYGSLQSYSCTIKHHDSSGLFPGDYEQTLKFRAPNVFELKVTKPAKNPQRVIEGQSFGMAAPEYYAKDGRVWRISKDDRSSDSFDHDENIGPGWEVSGGFTMMMLAKTSSTKFFLEPRDEIKVSYGPPTNAMWRGEKVREIVMKLEFKDHTSEGKMYIAAESLELVGMEWKPGAGDAIGYAHYTDRVVNPTLPANLGEVPPPSR